MKSFLILGASKTGTSTVVAVANAHPSVFTLFETDFTKAATADRNADFTAKFPEGAGLFGSRPEGIPYALLEVGRMLALRGWNYEWVGTKIQGIRPDLLSVTGCKILFLVRDIRFWAVKNRVIANVFEDQSRSNIVPFLTSYTEYLVRSYLNENCTRLRFDDIAAANMTAFPKAISNLVELPQGAFENWWEKAPGWTRTEPKNYSTWVNGHASAFMPPVYSDTTAKLLPHPFWDQFLPLFDKYFQGTRFSKSEIETDLKELARLSAEVPMSIDEGYEEFLSYKAQKLAVNERGKFVIDPNPNGVVAKKPGGSWSHLVQKQK